MAVMGGVFYWDERVEPWMRTTLDRWYVATAKGILALAVMMTLMMAPAVLGLVRGSVNHLRTA